jgi:hypothetical protein
MSTMNLCFDCLCPRRPRSRSPRRLRHQDLPHSATLETMLLTIGTGRSCPTEQHRLAHSMVEDGIALEPIRMMASLGCSGKWPANIEREMHVRLLNLYNIDIEPYTAKMPLQGAADLVTRECDLPCLLPHEIIHGLFSAGRQQFQISMLGPEGQDGLLKYWRWARTQDWGRKHPALQGQTDEQLSMLIPLMLHVDGAEVFRNSEFYIFSVRSALAEGAPYDIIFPFLMVRQGHMIDANCKKRVFERACELFNWSICIAEEGVGPTVGFHGEPILANQRRSAYSGKELAGGFRACYVGVKHDAKAKMELHRESQWYSCTYICSDCHAVQGLSMRQHTPTPTHGHLQVTHPGPSFAPLGVRVGAYHCYHFSRNDGHEIPLPLPHVVRNLGPGGFIVSGHV